MRTLANGDILFGKKEKIPDNLSGYVQDFDDPQLFHPVFPECIHHKETFKIIPNCKKKIPFEYCSLKTIQLTSAQICQTCSERVPP